MFGKSNGSDSEDNTQKKLQNVKDLIASSFNFCDAPEPYLLLNFVFSNTIFVYQCCVVNQK